MANTPPPKFTLPPPKNKRQQSQQAAFKAYINAHPSMRGYAQAIYKASINNGIDPVYYASLLWKESFAAAVAEGVSPETIESSKGAVGIAQIRLSAHPGVTRQQAQNASFAINWGASYLAQGVRKYGSYDAAYRKQYNPGYTGPVFNDLPQGYVATGTQKSPGEQAQRSVDVSTAEKNLTDPYVTIRGGKLVKSTQQGAIKVFGQPLRRSQFLSTWQNLNDLYLAYTGKPVTARAVKDILSSGKSRYQIIDILSKGPNFQNSPVWKQNAPGYVSVWKSIYGADSNPDPAALRYAIVNNLGGEGFAQTLRARPDYEKSNEFKGNEASMSAVYTKIYGVPDANGIGVVKAATRQGQSPDVFAAYLRAQPEYQQSGEFKSRALGFASALGFVTGQQPTLNNDLIGGPPVGSTSTPPGTPAGVLGGK